MRFTKEFPLFIGWLSSTGITLALTRLIALPFRDRNFAIQEELAKFIALFIAFYLLAAFLMFMMSIQVIVIPLYRRNKAFSADNGQIKFPAYLHHWFLCWVYTLLYYLPLICWDSLFTITPTPPAEKAIKLLWQLAASYFAYRLVVKRWLEEPNIDNRPENEEQIFPA